MPYYPTTYQNPYQVYQPQYQQQAQQSGIIWVSGDAEAIAYPIAPNNAVRLWHSSLPIVYFKSADASGRPTLKAYDLTERTENASAASELSESKLADFATKDELSALSQAIDTIKSEMKTMRKELKKRREVDDDDDE